MPKKVAVKRNPKNPLVVVPTGRTVVSRASERFIEKLGHVPHYYGALYLERFTNPEKLAARIDMAVRALRGHKFDCIAFTGMSGMLIGPPVALRLGKTFLMVRKDAYASHSTLEVEGDYAAHRYIILDDFTESGNTIRRIREAIAVHSPDAKYVGFLGVAHITEGRLAVAEKRLDAGKDAPYILEK